jgi:hypothetical protein
MQDYDQVLLNYNLVKKAKDGKNRLNNLTKMM